MTRLLFTILLTPSLCFSQINLDKKFKKGKKLEKLKESQIKLDERHAKLDEKQKKLDAKRKKLMKN